MTRREFFGALPMALIAGPTADGLAEGGRVWERRWGWFGRRVVRVESAPGGAPLSPEEIAHARWMVKRMVES